MRWSCLSFSALVIGFIMVVISGLTQAQRPGPKKTRNETGSHRPGSMERRVRVAGKAVVGTSEQLWPVYWAYVVAMGQA